MNDAHPKLTARIKLLILVTATLIGAFAVIKLTMTKAGFELDSKVYFSRDNPAYYQPGKSDKDLPSRIRKRLVAEGFEFENSNRFVGRYKYSPRIMVTLNLGNPHDERGLYCETYIEHLWQVPMGTHEYHDSMKQLFEEFDEVAQGWVDDCRDKSTLKKRN